MRPVFLSDAEQQQDSGETACSEGADHGARAAFPCAETVQPEAQSSGGLRGRLSLGTWILTGPRAVAGAGR